MEICKAKKIKMRHLIGTTIYGYVLISIYGSYVCGRQMCAVDRCKRYADLSVMGIRVSEANCRVIVANVFMDHSIGIDKTNTFQLKCFILHENCRHHRLGRLTGVRVSVANFFLGQSIGIDEQYISVKNNTFQLNFMPSFYSFILKLV